jgi:glycosyltransferase involved in cell wall biosynthesis
VRVAVDARPAVFSERTGVGIYVWSLLRWLPQVDPETTYVAWYLDARCPIGARRLAALRAPNLVERRTRIPSRVFEPLARRLGIPRLEWLTRFDVLFAPNFIPPPTRAGKLVVTVHDLAFRRFPSRTPERTLRWLSGLEGVIRRATRIIVPSHSTHRDLVDLFGVPEDRMRVIPHGVDPRFAPPAPGDAERVRNRLGIRGPYLLFIGGLEPRKNLPNLVQAFAKLTPGPVLVVAGSGVPWNPEGRLQVEEALRSIPAEARERILLAGYVDPDLTPALIGSALALVYPSLYEGFGLPALEAMACGTPLLASSASALPEVVGDAGLLVNPMDVDAIADGMAMLVQDEQLRAGLREAGLQRAAGYTWDRTAKLTARVLREAGKGS